MHTHPEDTLSRFERLISIFCPLRPKDGTGVCLFGLSGFMLMFAYYLLRPVREALVLTDGNEEIRSYAVGVNAIVLLLILPLYGRWISARPGRDVFNGIMVIAIACLLAFFLAGLSGLPIGIPFFIWLGAFSLLVVAQFWAVATDVYDVETGQRVFPAIAIGLSLGAWAGSKAASVAFAHIGANTLVLTAAGVLGLVLAVYRIICRRVLPRRHSPPAPRARATTAAARSGVAMVLASPHLGRIALLVVLLNWIDTGGDYILAHAVRTQVDAISLASGAVADRTALIGNIYGEFFAWTCLLGAVLQLLVVSRLFRRVRVGGALFVLPIIMFLGYGLMSFVPVFTIIYVVKIIEAATDYSVQSTARQALFLPLDRNARHQGKTAIDTFFWRCGDLAQAVVIFVGLHVMDLSTRHFMILNLALAAIALALTIVIAREHACVTGAARARSPRPRLRSWSRSLAWMFPRYRHLQRQEDN